MADFVEYQSSVGQGTGLDRKVFYYISCSSLPTRRIGSRCVDVSSALNNNVVQAGLVFDVVLYLPNISRLRCHLIKKFCRNLNK